MSLDAWESLESEFQQEQLKTELNLPEGTPENKGFISLKERLAQFFLNGSIPVLGVATLAEILQRSYGFNFGIFCTLALLPIVWLLRPLLFPGTRAHHSLLFFGAVMVGGLTELLFTLPIKLDAQLAQSDSRRSELIAIFQNQMEDFLSLGHLVAYVFCGLALVVAIRETRQKFPWLDLKPTSKVRLWVTWLGLVVAPFLLGAWMIWQHPWSPKEQAWLDEMAADPLNQTDGVYTNRAYRPDESAAEAEAALLDEPLGVQPNPFQLVLKRERIWTAFSNQEELKTPHLLSLKVLGTREGSQTLGDAHYVTHSFLSEKLLPFLATADLNELPPETTEHLKSGAEYTSEVFSSLDRLVYENCRRVSGWQFGVSTPAKTTSYGNIPEPTTMSAFGYSTDLSPTYIYFRWRSRSFLKTWVDNRESFRGLSRGETIKALASNSALNRDISIDGFTANYSRHLQSQLTGNRENLLDLIQAARLILALRDHKTKNGAWPENFDSFAREQGIEAPQHHLEFAAQSGSLRYGKTWTMLKEPGQYRWVKKNGAYTEWKLQ